MILTLHEKIRRGLSAATLDDLRALDAQIAVTKSILDDLQEQRRQILLSCPEPIERVLSDLAQLPASDDTDLRLSDQYEQPLDCDVMDGERWDGQS